jgi:hypothetical protein
MARAFGRKGGMIRQRSREMNKIKLGMIFLAAVAFFGVLVLQAQTTRQLQLGKIGQKAVTKIEPLPTTVPQRAPVIGSRQGYQMVTDILDGFGGESESANYRIPVNSGGQPSSIGISESDNFVVKAGFVLASDVKRGDANLDGAIGAGDIVYLLNYLFRADDPPCPMEAGDANCDGVVGPGDIVFLLNYLYRGGPPPAC